jgi:hypothetical protein
LMIRTVNSDDAIRFLQEVGDTEKDKLDKL